MKLAVILVNYNTPAMTIECLENLKTVTIPDKLKLKTILIDNGSKDDSVDLFNQRYPEVELIQSSQNLGFAGGNNLGIKAALKHFPTHLLLLNNDTILPSDFYEAILDSAINRDNVGIVTPKIYFAKGYEFHKGRYSNDQLGKVIWSAGGHIDWNNLLATNNHVDEVDEGQLTQIETSDFATGACLLMKSEVVKQVGLINEDYYLYLEDLEFSQRAKNAGWKIIFDPAVYLWHKVSQSSAIGSDLNDYFITRNRLLFGLKYAPIRTRIALLREALFFLLHGRTPQKFGVRDWFFHNLGKGTFIK